jgi:hypothetical protein
MKTKNFEKLIQAITTRDFIINTQDEELQFNKEYYIYKTLPITERKVIFKWTTPQTEEKLLKSFITAFTTKYFEPRPESYSGKYGTLWSDKTEKEKEYAYMHHRSNMYSKTDLLNQIQLNFENELIYESLIKYGFYHTEYGIGIFVFWATKYVIEAISYMKQYLDKNNIPYSNEFSDAKWVYRFKININKDKHYQILKSFQ